MLIETGVVVRCDSRGAWVQTLRKTTCGSCQARQGCGQNLLQRLMPTAADIWAKLPSDQSVEDLHPGDEVEIAIRDGALLAASLLAYGLPLAMLILGVLLAEVLAFAESLQFLMGILGLAAGLLVSRMLLFSQFKPAYFEPQVVRNLGALPVRAQQT